MNFQIIIDILRPLALADDEKLVKWQLAKFLPAFVHQIHEIFWHRFWQFPAQKTLKAVTVLPPENFQIDKQPEMSPFCWVRDCFHFQSSS